MKALSLPDRRGRRRYIKRMSFRSVYVSLPVEPPFRWFLSASETAAALGVDPEKLKEWRETWRTAAEHIGPPPVYLAPKYHNLRYRYDDVLQLKFPNRFIDQMRRARRTDTDITPAVITDRRYLHNRTIPPDRTGTQFQKRVTHV
jgi:hypothetical protein